MKNICVVIPAIKKNAVIPDQLVKKMSGVTLIQRMIDQAIDFSKNRSQVLILTDSDEISLIAKRNKIPYFKDKKLKISEDSIIDEVSKFLLELDFENFLLLRGSLPLLKTTNLIEAYNLFLMSSGKAVVVSVKDHDRTLFRKDSNHLTRYERGHFYEELLGFYIINKNNLLSKKKYIPFIVPESQSIEVDGYNSWWICEKILQRKRIVFYVIGNTEIGMGHIYHSISLAHEIIDHKIIFVCKSKDKLALQQIASYDYEVLSYDNPEREIPFLDADIVINDVLDTDENYILNLKKRNSTVINFEDLGDGGKHADLVINELYESPVFSNKNYLWGHRCVILRDEFHNATRNILRPQVKKIMLIFGGSDPNNLTGRTFDEIASFCQQHKITIDIVCGNGYLFFDALKSSISNYDREIINLHQSTKTISQVMEGCDLAISSNGRTVYELVDMNIPSIIVSHHEREDSHNFATRDNGFEYLGIANENIQHDIYKNFKRLVTSYSDRESLFNRMLSINIRDNKKQIIREIYKFL